MYGAPPHQHQPPHPAPPSGPSVGLIVGLVAGGFALLIVGLFIAGAVVGFMAVRRRAAAVASSGPASPSRLTQRYATKNGLAVAHYPADFAAKSIDDTTLLVSRVRADGTDEAIAIAAVDNPITDDANELARLLVDLMAKKIAASGDTWTETARTQGPCFLGHAGVSVEGKFTTHAASEEHVRSCFFISDGRAYEMKTIIAAAAESSDMALLQSILEATELK